MGRPFLIALRFLTRLPVPEPAGVTTAEVGRSMLFYPVVGVIIGLLLAAVDRVLQGTPNGVHGVLLLAAWVWVTGALHLDGLADSADAWLGGLGDRDRTLAIMKDPHCGPAAVIAVVWVLLLKAAALQPSAAGTHGMALVVIPAIARAALPLLFLTTPYVRPAGLGTPFVEHLPRRPAIIAVISTAVLIPAAAGWKGCWLLGAAAVAYILLRRMMLRRIGGTTGDTAGATVELLETVLLIAAATI